MSADIIHLQDRLRRPLSIRSPGILVEEIPTYQLLHVYLIDVTPEQLASALRTTTLVMSGQHGAHVIRQRPQPPDAA